MRPEKRDGGPPEPPSPTPTPDPAATKRAESDLRIQTGSDGGRSRGRAARLRKLIPGADPGLVDALAARPVTDVDLIVMALRQARRDALAADKERRRQRKRDDKTHGNYDDDDLADRDNRLARAHAVRAGRNLDTLTRLKQHYDDGPAVLALAVAGARAQGFSDAEIGRALGITRQAVWKRFTRQPGVDKSRGADACLFCGTSLAGKRADAHFCSDRHRSFWYTTQCKTVSDMQPRGGAA